MDFPAAQPPPGVKSNFINPPNHEQQLIILDSFWMSLMAIFVVLRIYARFFITRQKIGVDDGKWNDVPFFFASSDLIVVTCVLAAVSLQLKYVPSN